ncbi:MAG: hypothetical protein Q7W30_00635 [Coriobacteriia bacterium]|nr:hypothetical protein [Coriobacteriia bacterium]
MKDSMPAREARARVPEWIPVTVLYVLAHGWMLLDRGVFWDDWVYFRQPPALLADLARQLGSIWPGWTFAIQWGSEWSVWATRGAVFLAYLAVALMSLRLLRRVTSLDAQARVSTAALVAVFPVMGARDAVSNSAYAFSLALFFAGWCLLDSAVGRRRVVLRISALALLALSLRTTSLGLFYLVIPFWLVWREGVTWRRPRELGTALLRYADVIALPLAFLVLRGRMFAPSGIYEGYNRLTAAGLVKALWQIPAALYNSFVVVLARMPSSMWWPVAILATAIAVIALSRGSERDTATRWWLVAVVGVFAFVLGVYPYLAVGKMPALPDFDSRHQLLVPFGAALMLVGGVRGAAGFFRAPRVVSAGVLALLIGASVGVSAAGHLAYQREWYKQLGMIEALRTSAEAHIGRTFLFEERSAFLNVNGRTYKREYEYSGLFAEAFGTHQRFGPDRSEYGAHGAAFYSSRFTAPYKLDGYRAAPPDYAVLVEPGPADLRDDRVLARLLIAEWSGSPRLMSDAATTVHLRFEPLR